MQYETVYYVYADSQTPSEDGVTALALENQNVVGAKCFFCADKCVVAILTGPFYLKSERDEFLKSLQTDLSNRLKRNVIVTADVDVFRKIKPDMSEAQKADLLKTVTSRT